MPATSMQGFSRLNKFKRLYVFIKRMVTKTDFFFAENQ
jgi:hypothetical protein